jgi:hypothetical protein
MKYIIPENKIYIIHQILIYILNIITIQIAMTTKHELFIQQNLLELSKKKDNFINHHQ